MRVLGAMCLCSVLCAVLSAQSTAPSTSTSTQHPALSGISAGVSAAIARADGTVQTFVTSPLKPTDRLLIGSVGKTFAAARALQLIEQHKLALDDPISKYLGAESWFARLPNARTASVRHLMTHTSGLVRYEFKEAFARDLRAQPDKVWKPEELLSYVFDEAPPFAPGQGWEYSDTNYIVLGMILEKIDGRPFYEQVRREIFPRMPGTRLVPSTSRTIPDLAQGYTAANDPITGAAGPVIVDGKFVVSPQFEWTGGGFAGTPSDLARWAKLLYEGDVFAKRETARLMIDAAVPARLGPQARYGLGVIVRPQTPVGEVWGHSGFFPGYLTEMIYLPGKRIAVAVQVNTSNQRAIGRSPLRIAYDLAADAAR